MQLSSYFAVFWVLLYTYICTWYRSNVMARVKNTEAAKEKWQAHSFRFSTQLHKNIYIQILNPTIQIYIFRFSTQLNKYIFRFSTQLYKNIYSDSQPNYTKIFILILNPTTQKYIYSDCQPNYTKIYIFRSSTQLHKNIYSDS